MAVKLGINGFGRIGRMVYRAALGRDDVRVVAVNASYPAETLAHLLRYDSVHGRYPGHVSAEDGFLVADGTWTRLTAERDPSRIPWRDLGAEVVIEATGAFRDRARASGHLNGGARLVIITAPPKDESIPMIVIGVNHTQFQPGQDGLDIVSNASCTTNCLAPVCHVLDSVFGIEQGVMTTVHSFTNDQRLVDNPHKDLRRARSAHQAIIPTTTGAARSLGRILPRLAGRLDGYALRVPTPDVSIANLTVALSRPATVAEVNEVFRRASEGSLRGILGYTEEPLVSADFIGDQRSAVVDGSLTYVLPGGLVHVAAWYDNEWAYACRTLDLAAYLGAGVGVATRAVSE